MDEKDLKIEEYNILLDKEKSVIGTMLYYPQWIDNIKFSEEHFSGIYRKIYQVIQQFRAENREISIDGVLLKLQGIPNIRASVQACLDQHFMFMTDYEDCCLYLIEEKSSKKIVEIGSNLRELYNEGKSLDFLIEYAQSNINKVSNYIYNTGTAVNGEECYNKFYEEYIEVVRNKDNNPFVSSGFTEIDNIFKFRSGLYIIAGRPAMGKTAIGLIIGRNVSKNGNKVVIRSLEMSSNELMMRYACASLEKYEEKEYLRMYRLDKEELKSVPQRFCLNNMLIDDSSASIEDIIADTRQLKNDGKCDFLVIDYLSLIKTSRGERRDIEVSDITTKLKLLSKELNIPVLLLAQLNRAVEQRPDKKPILADLRESGGIEQDADVVMMIYRPKYYNIDEYTTLGNRRITTENLGVVIVRKNRHGRIGEAYLKFNSDMTDACDWDFQGEPKSIYGDDVEYIEDDMPF